MVNRFWFFTAFLASFYSVYASLLLYSIIPTIFNMGISWERGDGGNAFITSANATIAIGSTANWLPTVGIIIMATIIIGFLVSGVSIKRAFR